LTGYFALAVFGGLVGDILLILKKAIAYYLFAASLLGVIVTNIHTIQVSSDMNILVGSLMSLVVSAFLIWYAKTTPFTVRHFRVSVSSTPPGTIRCTCR
jgi:uncharacterized membrane protein YeiH